MAGLKWAPYTSADVKLVKKPVAPPSGDESMGHEAHPTTMTPPSDVQGISPVPIVGTPLSEGDTPPFDLLRSSDDDVFPTTPPDDEVDDDGGEPAPVAMEKADASLAPSPLGA